MSVSEQQMNQTTAKLIELDKKVDVMATKLDYTAEEIAGLKGQMSQIIDELRKTYPTKAYVDTEITNAAKSIREEYTPVKRIVYGAVGIILTSALIALIALIVKS